MSPSCVAFNTKLLDFLLVLFSLLAIALSAGVMQALPASSGGIGGVFGDVSGGGDDNGPPRRPLGKSKGPLGHYKVSVFPFAFSNDFSRSFLQLPFPFH